MIRESTGEVKLIWRLILVILLYVVILVLLRLIPIGCLTASMVKDGMTRESAVEIARTIIFEDPIWSMGLGILSGLMGFLMVWFLVRVVEKSAFAWKAFGLDWRRSSPSMILLGVLLAGILFAAYMLVAHLLGVSVPSANMLLAGVSLGVIFQKFFLFMAMGFGEEIVFRAYVQTKLVGRLGVIWGVLVAALVFTLLHQISYALSPVTLLSGLILWTTLGALYHLTKSLYLVGTFHGIMNMLMNTLSFEVGNVDALIVHVLALCLAIVIALFKIRGSGIRTNPV
jgi:membrane protease YdiL (CAAX protease family)